MPVVFAHAAVAAELLRLSELLPHQEPEADELFEVFGGGGGWRLIPFHRPHGPQPNPVVTVGGKPPPESVRAGTS